MQVTNTVLLSCKKMSNITKTFSNACSVLYLMISLKMNVVSYQPVPGEPYLKLDIQLYS